MLLSKFNSGLETKAAALAGKNQLMGGWLNDVLVVYVAYKTSLSLVGLREPLCKQFAVSAIIIVPSFPVRVVIALLLGYRFNNLIQV